jgi:hypothetical protein
LRHKKRLQPKPAVGNLRQNLVFAMYGIAFLVLLPLLGWWLIRATRSLDQLAKVVNEHKVDLGFLSLKGKTSAILLFSDVRFVLWLVRRKYQSLDVPPAVIQVLDKARHDYVMVNSAMGIIIFVGLATALNNQFG